MATLRRLKTSIREQRQADDIPAKAEKMAADLEYLAMMTDVELEDETETEEVESE